MTILKTRLDPRSNEFKANASLMRDLVNDLRAKTEQVARGGTIGVLHGYYVGTVQVTNYSLHLSIVYLTVIVLGGPGRLGGAIWAAVLVTILPHALNWALRKVGVDAIGGAAGVENIALGLILIVVLLGAPQRLWALLRMKGPR